MKDYKKYICKIFIFVIFFVILNNCKSMANVSNFKTVDGDKASYNPQIDLVKCTVRDDKTLSKLNPGVDLSEVFSDLSERIGYSGSRLDPIIKKDLKITVIKVKDKDEYQVKLGNLVLDKDNVSRSKEDLKKVTDSNYFTKDELESIFGYDPADSEFELYDSQNNKKIDTSGNRNSVIEGSSVTSVYWYADIIADEYAKYMEKDSLVSTDYIVYVYDYSYSIQKIYTGKDRKENYDIEQTDADAEGFESEVTNWQLSKIAKEFLKHAVESTVTAFLDGIVHIGDALQTIANLVQTGMENLEVEYYSSEFVQEESNDISKTNLNSYVNYKEGQTSNGQYDIFISSKDENGESHGFTPDTKIPVISSDIYTLATNKVDFVKSNFLVKDGTEGTIWTTIRNFVAGVIHAVMYIILALLLLAMIWHGTGMVKCSIIGSVSEKNKHITALHKLEAGFIMLACTLFIEAICLYLSDSIFEDVNVKENGNKYEGPIRVSVETEIRTVGEEIEVEENPDYKEYDIPFSDKNINGFDISYHQGNIKLKALKNGGGKFVILRAGITYSRNGRKAKDTKFETYYEDAKENGLDVGAYWYTGATTYEKGVEEAEYLCDNCLDGKQFEYPIYIDVEANYIKGERTGVTEAVKGFCETLQSRGYLPGIYCSDGRFNELMKFSEISKYELWVARYTYVKPTHIKSYGMWQPTSTGRVSGFGGRLDKDIAYKDYPNYIKNAGLNGYGSGSGSSGSSGSHQSTMPGVLTGTVEGTQIYSFSTTPTGYIRYMANIGNIYLYGKRALYVVAYIGLSIANLIATIAMIIRMILMMFLAVIGFIIIIKYILKSQNASTKGYFVWIKMYAGLASVQVIFAVIARVLLEVIFKT